MTVMVLERAPASVRGELTRWLLEVHAGVFVGTVSALVRERLWEHVCGKLNGGAGLLIYRTDTEQGFAMRLWGAPDRSVIDYDGLYLIQRPH